MSENLQGSRPQEQAATPRGAAMLALLNCAAKTRGACDLHLEPGPPATIRISSGPVRESRPITPDETMSIAKELLGDADWAGFERLRSADLAQTIEGVRRSHVGRHLPDR